jgi:thiol-disulfide isomerase/thioredoxin
MWQGFRLRVVLTSIIAVAVFALVRADATAADVTLRVGQPAPAWSLADPSGEMVRFPEDARGRPAVMLFWATWCPFCRALMPHLQEIRAHYADSGVQIFAVNIREDGDPVAFVSESSYDFIVALDGDAVAERYGVMGTPGLFVVGRHGRIAMNRFLITLEDSQRGPAGSATAWARLVREALDQTLQE